MTLEELIAAYRQRAGDTATPPNRRDEGVATLLNAAEQEACERSLLILDTSTPEVCEIDVVAGTATYDLHTSILKLLRAKLDAGATPLEEISIEKLDAQEPGWETRTGSPHRFFQTSETSITLVPIPVADDIMRLRVNRGPLEPMVRDDDEPEIAQRHHFNLVDWALHLHYLDNDSEVLDQVASERHAARFTGNFGARPDANVQRKQRDRRPPVVRMGAW